MKGRVVFEIEADVDYPAWITSPAERDAFAQYVAHQAGAWLRRSTSDVTDTDVTHAAAVSR